MGLGKILELADNRDYLLLKVSRTTPFLNSIIGGFSEPLNEELCIKNKTDPVNGCDHIMKLERFGSLLYGIHEHPPRASRDLIDIKVLEKYYKDHDLEVWRMDLSNEEQHKIIEYLFQILKLEWNNKKNKYIGVRYNWTALFFAPLALLGIAIRGSSYHCASAQAKAALMIGKVMSSDGENDALVSVNNCLNGGLLHKIHGVYRED